LESKIIKIAYNTDLLSLVQPHSIFIKDGIISQLGCEGNRLLGIIYVEKLISTTYFYNKSIKTL